MLLQFRVYIIAVITLFFLFNSCKTKTNKLNNSDNNNISFTEISKGSYGGLENQQYIVLKDNASYKKLFSDIYRYKEPKPAITEIDFNKHMVLALFMGMKNSGGYSISIDSIVSHKEELHVFINKTSPKGKATMAMTQPFYIAEIQKTNQKIVFK